MFLYFFGPGVLACVHYLNHFLMKVHGQGYIYNYIKLVIIFRDLSKPWIFMTYESATNVRQRSSNWGRYPPINWHKINHVFNRTMTFRKDSDVTVR